MAEIQYQLAPGVYVNETADDEYQIAPGLFINETVEEAPPPGLSIPIAMHHYQHHLGV